MYYRYMKIIRKGGVNMNDKVMVALELTQLYVSQIQNVLLEHDIMEVYNTFYNSLKEEE